MKTTWYFDNRVRPRRPYLTMVMCAIVLSDPIRTEEQPDGRFRFWGEIYLPGENRPRIMRVVTLSDGETIHNAFIDSGFRR
ncbi:MAG: hypothetical protein F4W95_11460 [Chloroflexi bacterium]|nr:hypothetical protein [Chloroflexota bacterium]MYD49083.1 hypothetical protein [Chloroflexota bacterium]